MSFLCRLCCNLCCAKAVQRPAQPPAPRDVELSSMQRVGVTGPDGRLYYYDVPRDLSPVSINVPVSLDPRPIHDASQQRDVTAVVPPPAAAEQPALYPTAGSAAAPPPGAPPDHVYRAIDSAATAMGVAVMAAFSSGFAAGRDVPTAIHTITTFPAGSGTVRVVEHE